MRGLLLALTVLLAAGGARADDPFPNHAIKMIVPFPAGGPTDLIARIVAQGMSDALGQSVVIDNRSGAGGGIGTTAAAKSPPDGYTIIMATVSTAVLNLHLYKKLDYDPVKDFAPISLVVNLPNVMVVHPSVPGRTLPELIAYAKANPGKLSFASGGNGTITQLSAEVFRAQAGIDLLHVPYRGAGPALNAVLAGEASMMFDNLPTSLPHIRSGGLRTYGVTTLKRSPAAPEIPTVAESGLPGYETYTWNALFAPAGTPAAIVDRLYQSALTAINNPVLEKRLADIGAEKAGGTPAELASFLDRQIAEWGVIIKQAGIQPE